MLYTNLNNLIISTFCDAQASLLLRNYLECSMCNLLVPSLQYNYLVGCYYDSDSSVAYGSAVLVKQAR
jgi:hypothetical protein